MALGLRHIGGRHALALVVAIPCALVVKHGCEVYTSIRAVYTRRVVSSSGLSENFKQSHTLKTLVNPRGHASSADRLALDLDLPKNARDLSDEVLLATFIHGFFAGKVLAIERLLLQTARPTLVSYAGLNPISASNQIWKTEEISCKTLPPVHSVVFGTFQVSHVKLIDSKESQAEPETESSVDFVFGKDISQFAGAHRFSIVRSSENPARVKVVYESTACNPTRNHHLSGILLQFHSFYAMLLFREGVSEILRMPELSA
ncbi:hypothetical protein CPAR01_10021 [Colletotrichum paranaense]|uniref:Uncharacterized protein n=1 Tax=Colletotrichum paranaense TaxID=1914294 RepID=A0ABQ9SE20_9PEZI|nr:uncharacterized protein CPAR01_10021 [Colletotrichum paranaense]KAK1533313.1 hypothetical protein CPAR01_10021 [Colletotrichum paranaense]